MRKPETSMPSCADQSTAVTALARAHHRSASTDAGLTAPSRRSAAPADMPEIRRSRRS